MLLSKEKLREILVRCLDGYLPTAAMTIDTNRHLNDLQGHPAQGMLEPWARTWLMEYVEACVADHKEHRFSVVDLADSLPDVARAFRVLFVCPVPDVGLADALLVDFLNTGVFGNRWCFDLAFCTDDLRKPR